MARLKQLHNHLCISLFMLLVQAVQLCYSTILVIHWCMVFALFSLLENSTIAMLLLLSVLAGIGPLR
jgi:hypothetical protein